MMRAACGPSIRPSSRLVREKETLVAPAGTVTLGGTTIELIRLLERTTARLVESGCGIVTVPCPNRPGLALKAWCGTCKPKAGRPTTVNGPLRPLSLFPSSAFSTTFDPASITATCPLQTPLVRVTEPGWSAETEGALTNGDCNLGL